MSVRSSMVVQIKTIAKKLVSHKAMYIEYKNIHNTNLILYDSHRKANNSEVLALIGLRESQSDQSKSIG